MARLLIYDAYENKVYTYANLNENDPMPYSTGTTLRVREFRLSQTGKYRGGQQVHKSL